MLIMCWFLADVGKTAYFIVGGQPIPFIMCGVIQTFVDILIMGQIYMYKKPEPAKGY